MANKTPPPRTNNLHSKAGVTLAASEATAIAAGDTIIHQNNGNTVVRVVATTGGTGTVKGLITPANDQAVTLAVGDNLLGPFDPAIFGSTVTITTATAVGSVALYQMAPRIPNGLSNPFETNAAAPDSP